MSRKMTEIERKEVQDVALPILTIIKNKFPESGKALFKHQLNIDIDSI